MKNEDTRIKYTEELQSCECLPWLWDRRLPITVTIDQAYRCSSNFSLPSYKEAVPRDEARAKFFLTHNCLEHWTGVLDMSIIFPALLLMCWSLESCPSLTRGVILVSSTRCSEICWWRLACCNSELWNAFQKPIVKCSVHASFEYPQKWKKI